MAESFSRIEINSERLSKAKAFFEQGKFREADAILKTEDMRSDGEKLLTRAAQLTSEMQKNDNGLLIVSTEFLIKAQLTTINYTIKSQFDSAKTYFRQSLRYFETPENLIAFADFYRENHIYDSAIQLYSRLITRPKAEAWQKANAYSHLGELYTTQGYLNEELKAYTIFFEIYDSLSKRDTLSSFYKINLAVSYQKLGSLHNSLDDFDNALFFHHKGIKLFEELNITYPANVDFKSKLANSYLELGDVNAKLKCNNIALYFYDKGIKLFEELNVFYPTNVDFKNNVAVSCGKLGNTQMKLDSLDKALVYFEKNLEILIELYNAYPNKVDYKYNLAIAYLQLGNMGIPLKNLEKEMRFYDKGIKLFEELNISYPTNVWFKNGLAITLAKLGRCCQKQNKNANQAKIYFQKAEKLWLALIKDASQYADFKKSLEIVQQDLKDLDTGKN